MHGTQVTQGPAEGTVEPRLVSVTAAAQALAINRRHLYRIIAAGEIETVSLGRRRLIPVDALDAYVVRLREQHEVA